MEDGVLVQVPLLEYVWSSCLLEPTSLVNSLIDEDLKMWSEPLIDVVFLLFKVAQINKIPFSSITWCSTSRYTVRSAYHRLMFRHEPDNH